ncbi:MAG: hypothetical protein WBZ36_25020 [Candidatus Nitrosopolaris sp.]
MDGFVKHQLIIDRAIGQAIAIRHHQVINTHGQVRHRKTLEPLPSWEWLAVCIVFGLYKKGGNRSCRHDESVSRGWLEPWFQMAKLQDAQHRRCGIGIYRNHD